MRAGRLRHKVQFQKPVAGTSDYSDEVAVSWEDATENLTRTDIRLVSAKEISAAGGKVVHTDLAVIMRYSPKLKGMDNQWRMQYRGETYDVLFAVDPDMKRKSIKAHVRKQTV